MKTRLVLLSTIAAALALTEILLAQPAEVLKKESTRQANARYYVERRARALSEIQKELRDKFKLSQADAIAVQEFIVEHETQLQLVKTALYQVTLAEENDVSEEEYGVFWNDFQTLAAQQRTQRKQGEARLTERLNLRRNVRLQAFLTLRGVIGDELFTITSITDNFNETILLEYKLKRDLGIDTPKRVIFPAVPAPQPQ